VPNGEAKKVIKGRTMSIIVEHLLDPPAEVRTTFRGRSFRELSILLYNPPGENFQPYCGGPAQPSCRGKRIYSCYEYEHYSKVECSYAVDLTFWKG
jgi:hypothetical protein